MTKQTRRTRRGLVVLVAAVALTLSGHFGVPGRAAAGPPAAQCEGDACAQVSVTFDEAKGQHRVSNNSTERWVKVAASNVAASADVCVGPGRSQYLPLRSIAGNYRADYAAAACGTGGD